MVACVSVDVVYKLVHEPLCVSDTSCHATERPLGRLPPHTHTHTHVSISLDF